MMMGTKAENALAPPPKEAIKFIEDMDMDEIPSMVCLDFRFARDDNVCGEILITGTSIVHPAYSTSLGW